MTTILYAGAVLGVLGIVFGLVLNFAGKKFHVEEDERIEKVRACLGGANCGACGYPGCDGFAEAVVRGDAKPNGCAPAGEKGAAEIARIMGVEAQSTERLASRFRGIITTAIEAASWRLESPEDRRAAGSPASALATVWITARSARFPWWAGWRILMKRSAPDAARARKTARAARFVCCRFPRAWSCAAATGIPRARRAPCA